MRVVVDGLLINYEQSGSGKPVLLLHGWGDSLAGFRDLMTDLSAQYQVTAVDLPGFGQSESPSHDWGLTEYAQCVAAFLAKIEQKSLHAIVGHSNGGAIAIRGLARQDLVATRLVLLASAGVRGQYKGRMRALRYVTKAGKLAVSPLPSHLKQRLRRTVYRTVGSDMLVAEHLQGTFKKVVTDDVRSDAIHVPTPSLLLYGQEDAATPPAWGEMLAAALPHATFEVIEAAGHFVHHDQPEVVARRVREFLSS